MTGTLSITIRECQSVLHKCDESVAEWNSVL
jgi:hypothetical protein